MARIFSYGLVLSFSIFVSFLSHSQVGHQNYYLVSWFVGGWFTLLALGGILTWLRPAPIKLHPVLIFLCLLPLIGTEPLFENDQYRYFWEGKVLSEGLNPWRIHPSSEALDGIDFPERELVGYNKLTSPYSPLAVAYHALFSQFSYKTALIALQLVNALLCAGIFIVLPPLRSVYAVGIAALLGKEFAQSVHIDLLVWIFLWLAVTRMKMGSVKIAAAAFIVSSLLKVNILLMVPWFLCLAFRMQKYRGVVIWIFALIFALAGNTFGPLSFHESSGLVVFMKHWVWHSGVIALWETLGGEAVLGIQLANIVWVSGIGVLGVLCLVRQFDGWKWSTILFTFTAFWRPAFNGWYFPWFGLSAAIAGQEMALIYGLMSPLAYVRYAEPSHFWQLFFVFSTHLLGGAYLARQIKIKGFI